MVDAWTQTSFHEEDKKNGESTGRSKDKGKIPDYKILNSPSQKNDKYKELTKNYF